MANYGEDVPILRDIDAFKNGYFNCSRVKKMAHEWRYDLGEDTRLSILQIQKEFCVGWESSNPERKIECYETAKGLTLHVQHNLNTMNDFNVISNEDKARFDILSDNVKRQLQGIINSVRHKNGKRQNVRDKSLDKSTDGELIN